MWETVLIAAIGWQIATLILARSRRLSILALLAMVERDLLKSLREEAQKRKYPEEGSGE